MKIKEILKPGDQVKPLTHTIGTYDAVIAGELVKNIPANITFVSSTDEREAIKDMLIPGQFVALYGCGTVWQLKADKSWAEV